MIEDEKSTGAQEGTQIVVQDNKLLIPDNPVLCYIEGDGVGPEIATVTRDVIDTAVGKAYGGTKKIAWLKIYAGERAQSRCGSPLPQETIDTIKQYRICLKGPLTTPVGGGFRSLNVAIRQTLNLYACVRPVKHISGVPSPVKHPERVDMVIFRENTEDLYAGIEWQEGSAEALEVITFLNRRMGTTLSDDTGLGIKPISATATKRLIRSALDYALANNRKSVTLVTKGNIMKFTEGAFRSWAYDVVRDEYPDRIITEQEIREKYGGKQPDKQLIVKDRLADDMFQQVLLYPERYDVIAAPNLNGDYLSDALAAQVGGIGIAPGANIGHHRGVFEATHGTAPDIAGKNKANPTGLLLSAALMLDYMGWLEAAQLLRNAVETTIASRKVTEDLGLHSHDATVLSTNEFGKAVLDNC
jgi:isocitrate dehydrogenase